MNYRRRAGESSVTGDKVRAALLGVEMIAMILRYRILSWFGWRPRPRVPHDTAAAGRRMD